MSNKPDWTSWILEKNSKRVSDEEMDQRAKNIKDKPLIPLKGFDSKGRMIGVKGVPDPTEAPSSSPLDADRYEVHGDAAKQKINKDEVKLEKAFKETVETLEVLTKARPHDYKPPKNTTDIPAYHQERANFHQGAADRLNKLGASPARPMSSAMEDHTKWAQWHKNKLTKLK